MSWLEGGRTELSIGVRWGCVLRTQGAEDKSTAPADTTGFLEYGRCHSPGSVNCCISLGRVYFFLQTLGAQVLSTDCVLGNMKEMTAGCPYPPRDTSLLDSLSCRLSLTAQ